MTRSAPVDDAALRRHMAEIESVWPIRFLRVVPPERLPFPRAPRRINLLAVALPGLSALDVAGLEIELCRRIGREVAIIPAGSPIGIELMNESSLAAE